MDKKLSRIDPAGIFIDSDGSIFFRNKRLETSIISLESAEKPPGVNTGACNNGGNCGGDNGGDCTNGGVCSGYNFGDCQ
ncbi:hypothetical protein [Dyella sp.]|uniref:hypothetical protein n=1 Tax=Dyella sp. TaxID=1869338 RepID=UPI002ED51130